MRGGDNVTDCDSALFATRVVRSGGSAPMDQCRLTYLRQVWWRRTSEQRLRMAGGQGRRVVLRQQEQQVLTAHGKAY